ncbi:MAG: nucleotidyltransferase domain-containing protein [Chlorobi bacterium]|nr:nucleotidyltransferase domain-containing protein [Chlorobiota bacterium]
MSKTKKEILHLIKKKISEKDKNAEVILFGSQARNEETENSDWDVLILLNSSNISRETEKLFRELMFEIELETEKPISTFVFSKQEWHDKHLHTPLYDNIKKEGILL